LPGGARSSAGATYHGLESHSGQGTCSADDGVGGPTAELIWNQVPAVTSLPAKSERGGLWHALTLDALALGWRQPRSLRRLERSEHNLRDADGVPELGTSDIGCIYHRGLIRAEHRCMHWHALQVVRPGEDPSHARRCSVIAMDEAASAARAAALERARAAAREGARRLPAILAQQAKAAKHRRRLAEAIRMGMATASDEADYDAPNEASGSSSMAKPTASDQAQSFSDIKCKHGLPTVEEVFLYAPGTPEVSSIGAANDKVALGCKCKEFDGLSSADLAFWDGVSPESPGGSGGMASNHASGAVKRSADGDAAAPKRKAHKTVKVEKNVA